MLSARQRLVLHLAYVLLVVRCEWRLFRIEGRKGGSVRGVLGVDDRDCDANGYHDESDF